MNTDDSRGTLILLLMKQLSLKATLRDRSIRTDGQINLEISLRFFRIAEKVADIVETLSASKNMSAGYCMTKPGSYSDYLIP